MTRRITQEKLEPFLGALVDWRIDNHLTQESMGELFGVSRKTYVALENARWFPPPAQRAHWVTLLHRMDPKVADAFLAVIGGKLEDFALVVTGERGTAPSLDAKAARAIFDAALYAAAEEADLPAKTLRPIAASLLAKLAEGGLSLREAVALAKAKRS